MAVYNIRGYPGQGEHQIQCNALPYVIGEQDKPDTPVAFSKRYAICIGLQKGGACNHLSI